MSKDDLLWFTLGTDGYLEINIRHHERSSSIRDGVIGIFCDEAKRRGIELLLSSGFCEVGTDNRWRNYKVTLKECQYSESKLDSIFEELNEVAYDRNSHSYDVKITNQIIRKHFKSLK